MAKVIGKQVLDEGVEPPGMAVGSQRPEEEDGKENEDGNQPDTRYDACFVAFDQSQAAMT